VPGGTVATECGQCRTHPGSGPGCAGPEGGDPSRDRARASCPNGVPSLRVSGRVISLHALGTATGRRVTDVRGGTEVEGTVFAKGSADTDFGKDQVSFVLCKTISCGSVRLRRTHHKSDPPNHGRQSPHERRTSRPFLYRTRQFQPDRRTAHTATDLMARRPSTVNQEPVHRTESHGLPPTAAAPPPHSARSASADRVRAKGTCTSCAAWRLPAAGYTVPSSRDWRARPRGETGQIHQHRIAGRAGRQQWPPERAGRSGEQGWDQASAEVFLCILEEPFWCSSRAVSHTMS